MDLRVIGVLLLIPLLDIMLLVALATQLGGVVTVALVVLTALIGLLLARAEGRHTLQKLQHKLAKGEPPTDELLDAGLLLIAGVLMFTPGLVTDLVGLLLVLPPTRYPIRVATKRYVVKPYVDAQTGGFASGNVYIGGFPNADGDSARGEEFFRQGMDEGRPGSEPVDIDDDAYEFTDPEQRDDGDDSDDTTDRRP
jgi:UPF0716 protein FxsA